MQYMESLSGARGLFRTLGEFDVDKDSYGRIKIWAGRSAAVFRIVSTGGPERMLKCYLDAPPQFAMQRYDYLSSHRGRFSVLAPAQYLEKEMYVYDGHGRGEYHDVVVGDWVEGRTLENVIRMAANAGNGAKLGELAAQFDLLAAEVLAAPWAHGDIKPENIVVDDDGRMTLVDYDAMYIPHLAGNSTTQIGTRPYQHPARDGGMYDKHIDDYSIAIISVSLHALAHDPAFYAAHNDGEGIILSPAQVVAGRSPLHTELLRLWDRMGESRLYSLTEMLRNPSPRLDGLAETMAGNSLPKNCSGLVLAERNGRWGYASSSGELAIIPRYARAFGFSDGMAAVSLQEAWHFIDASGRVAIDCSAYRQVKPFSEGLAAVCLHDKWGYMDCRGNIVIAPRFDAAHNFRSAKAEVRLGANIAHIDREGNVIDIV